MFDYTYVWHSTGTEQGQWKRIAVTEVDDYQHKEANNFNCFASLQRYKTNVKEPDEDFISPLYFDIDNADLEKSKSDAIKVVTQLLSMGLSPAEIQIYFSGSKGFHILIDEKIVGISPNKNLHKILKHVVQYISFKAGKKEDGTYEAVESVDMVVYTIKRLLRLENSVHHKTKLYKIHLSYDELINLTTDEIKELAALPREKQKKQKVKLNTKFVEFYKRKEEEALELISNTVITASKGDFSFTKESEMPLCVQDIYGNGWKKDGDRNLATIQLACYFKEAGYQLDETKTLLGAWVEKHTTAKTTYDKQSKVVATWSVITSIYQEDEYKFDCGFIRSLHGTKEANSTDYDRVKCAGSFCNCLPKKDVGEAVDIRLSDSANAEYYGSLVKSNVMVAGKKQTPYIIPKRIEYVCKGKKTCKIPECPLASIPSGIAYKDISPIDKESISMCGVSDDYIQLVLKKLSGIYNCNKFTIDVIEHTNMEELLVIPMADDVIKYSDDTNTGKYVLRKVYTIGDMPLDENKYYDIKGWVYPHPKNQEGTIIVTEANALQDKTESFKLTPEVIEDFKKLKPTCNEQSAIIEKLQDLLDSITYNVTHIVKRDETLLAVLLTYHSALRLNTPWDTTPVRGWVETMLVGDTGTGKSALIEKFMNYVKLGNKVNAESTSRTGLTYKMEQTSSGAWFIVWGAWPLSDKELIWIDEASAIPKDEYGQMTLARSSGLLEVKRAVTAETPCRVRSILSTNAVQGRRLGDYSYGVQSLKDIMNNEDIRRFDFACFLRAGDVQAEEYNSAFETRENKYSAELIKNSILWAWSRKIDNIKFTDGAIDKIYEVANSLSKLYGNAVDVPLVSPSDQRNKLARLSTALAMLLHSTDATEEDVFVKEAHVEFIGNYLQQIYNSDGCGLNYLSRISVKEEDMSTEKFYELFDELRKNNHAIKSDLRVAEFLDVFSQQNMFRLYDLEAMLNLEKNDVRTLTNFLIRNKFLASTSSGYKKTPRFNAFISKAFKEGLIS